MKILTAAQTRAAEQAAVAAGMRWPELMENAGMACADVIRAQYAVENRSVCVLCGRGGNGGDGLVIARRLAEWGAQVRIILTSGIPTHADAVENYRRAEKMGLPIYDYSTDATDCEQSIRQADLLVDAIFGFGFRGAAAGLEEQAICAMNASSAPVFAVDLPSGAICDSGSTEGVCVRADVTVTFTTLKPCHVIFPAAECCGKVTVASIGMPEDVVKDTGFATVERADIQAVYAPRHRNSHKGNYGKPLLLCGSYGMAGAAIMAGKAALRSGAGIVQIALPERIYPIVAGQLPEAVFLPYTEVDGGLYKKIDTVLASADALLIGPGLGQEKSVSRLCRDLLRQAKCPVVLDADGINALAQRIDLIEKCPADVVLTPHPGEMARLCGLTIGQVEADRAGVAADLARRTGATVVLKGAHTLIAEPTGRVWVNLTGSAGMATGGSGDVLSGMITAFLGRGFDPVYAAKAAVHLHGLAGELAAGKFSETAMLPTDLIECLPMLFK